jgi:hypothetical protein
VTAALVIATGAIHFYLYRLYFHRIATIGPLFLANFAVGVLLGVLILRRPGPLWSAIGALFCLATLGAFLISVHWGLFGYHERLSGTWQERAAVVEIAGTLAGAVAAALAYASPLPAARR